MKVLVPVKRVIDYNVKVRVKADGSGVDLANVKMSMNPFDEIAVEAAIRLREAGTATEVVVVSIGVKQAQETLRTALAMGADRAILVEAASDVHQDIEPLAVAKILKGVVEAEQPGLVICGKQAIDNDMNATGQMLSALLGWSQATFASDLAIEGDAAVVTREGGRRHADHQGQDADRGDGGSADERAALCLAAQHHEGQEEAAGRKDRGRFRRRRDAAAVGREDLRAGGPQGRRDGGFGRRADRETERRSGGDLMAVLLIAEVTGGTLGADSTAKALTAAKALGDVTVLVAGTGVDAAAAEAATFDGVAKVLAADDAAYGNGLAEPLADLILGLAPGYSHILAPATSAAKNVLPRVAALLDVMVISEITAVVDADTFERPIYAGNAIQTVKSSDATKVATVRTATFEAAGKGGSAPVETISATADSGLSSWVEDKVAASDRPELTSARIVVSGGRGLGSEENFAMIEQLADKLGAAVGGLACGGRFGLCAERLAGGADRQGRGAAALYRRGHLGRDPAPRRDEGFEDHRRHQQGRGGADLPGGRLWPRGRPLQPRAGTDRQALNRI